LRERVQLCRRRRLEPLHLPHHHRLHPDPTHRRNSWSAHSTSARTRDRWSTHSTKCARMRIAGVLTVPTVPG
jgi:hypothetical protein